MITGRKKPSPEWVNLVAEALSLSDERRREMHVAAATDIGFELDLTLPGKPT